MSAHVLAVSAMGADARTWPSAHLPSDGVDRVRASRPIPGTSASCRRRRQLRPPWWRQRPSAAQTLRRAAKRLISLVNDGAKASDGLGESRDPFSSSRFCSVCPFTFGWGHSVCKPCSRLLNWLGGNKEYAGWFICGSDLGSAPLEKWELLPHSLEVWSSSSRPPHFPLHQSSVFVFLLHLLVSNPHLVSLMQVMKADPGPISPALRSRGRDATLAGFL